MNNHIKRSYPRQEVAITFPESHVYTAPIGTRLQDICAVAQQDNALHLDAPLIAGIVNGRLRELTYTLQHDATVIPITLANSDGGRIYRRSLILLMATALNELFPSAQVMVNYAVPDGGYYCQISHHMPLSATQIIQLETKMRQIVTENNPIVKEVISLDEAIELFTTRGDEDKVRLLQYRTRNELTIYRLRNNTDYYFGYMVPSTGYLTTFKLIHVKDGFILQYPRQENPSELGTLNAYSKLSTVFQQSNDWLARLNIEDVGSLNYRVSQDKIQELMLVSEALHEQNIANIAQRIAQRFLEGGVRVVAIAGPSSSGKTTFSKRLAIQLLAQGIYPFTLEMDNFFVDRALTPRDENGEYDFESLEAIDILRFNEVLESLLSGKITQLPRFDFLEGKSTNGREVRLQPKQIIIIEGIHGLNPRLFSASQSDSGKLESIFRIYISALTQLNVDSHNRVPTTDVRLLRRIVRDAQTRGYNATDTLNRWASVRRGEKRNIFPYQENADAMFNSTLVYELAALRPLAEPLLLQVAPNTLAHIEANRLLSFLRWVMPLKPHQFARIPDTSLLREFIGGSILADYHPGATE